MQKSISGEMFRYDLDTKLGHVRSGGVNYKVNMEKILPSEIKQAFKSDKPSLYTGEYKNKILLVDKLEVGSTIPPESV